MTDFFPLADRLRPSSIDDFQGQEHLTGEKKIIQLFVKNKRLSSLILWGPPGTGKTTLSRILVAQLDYPSVEFSATTAKLNEIRTIMEQSIELKKEKNKPLVVFIDEIHHFNKHAQDAFLPYVERGDIILIGTTIENPAYKINRALLSRLKIIEFFKLSPQILEKIFWRAIRIIKEELDIDLNMTDEAREILFHYGNGDARRMLNLVEILLHLKKDDPAPVDKGFITDVIQNKIGQYDRSGDDRYELISAFHKSVRNSDVDASLFWLYRMMEGGEDPLYILRRMIRITVEDIGFADPEALKLCLEAKNAYEFLGSPEGDLFLTLTTIYLATAPKSNSVYMTDKKMKEINEKYKGIPIPLHIINPHHFIAAAKGAGKDYLYAHDFKEKTTAMDTLPIEVEEKHFFQANSMGFEKKIKARIEYWKRVKQRIKQAGSSGSSTKKGKDKADDDSQ